MNSFTFTYSQIIKNRRFIKNAKRILSYNMPNLTQSAKTFSDNRQFPIEFADYSKNQATLRI